MSREAMKGSEVKKATRYLNALPKARVQIEPHLLVGGQLRDESS